jgi:hypothetical protein
MDKELKLVLFRKMAMSKYISNSYLPPTATAGAYRITPFAFPGWLSEAMMVRMISISTLLRIYDACARAIPVQSSPRVALIAS